MGRHKDRYAKYLNNLPLAVFVCRDEDSACEFCRAADPVVTACHSYAGEYPGEWDYAGRERMFFVAERAIHEGSLDAYALPALPPGVRVAQADGDRRAGGCQPLVVRVIAAGLTTRLGVREATLLVSHVGPIAMRKRCTLSFVMRGQSTFASSNGGSDA